MQDIEKYFKDIIESIFINDKLRLTSLGLLFTLIFALFTPFYIIYLKIKNIFVKSVDNKK